MENFAGKKRPIINLSLFTSFPGSFSSEKSMKSPRDFDGGVVGLGIVAAMTDSNQAHKFTGAAANRSLSPRSSPIPIVSPARPAANFKGGGEMVAPEGTAVVDELSESYTCVISHIGNSSVKKRVYLDDDKVNGVVLGDCSASAAGGGCVDSNAVFSASPLNFGGDVMREFGAPDFLSSCFLCNKQLHGLDIFMYSFPVFHVPMFPHNTDGARFPVLHFLSPSWLRFSIMKDWTEVKRHFAAQIVAVNTREATSAKKNAGVKQRSHWSTRRRPALVQWCFLPG